MIDFEMSERYNMIMSKIEPIRDYDINGNLIYARNSDGYEVWHKWDVNNNMIYYKDGKEECHWKWDTNSNLIHYRDNTEIQEWYDSDGNLIDKPT